MTRPAGHPTSFQAMIRNLLSRISALHALFVRLEIIRGFARTNVCRNIERVGSDIAQIGSLPNSQRPRALRRAKYAVRYYEQVLSELEFGSAGHSRMSNFGVVQFLKSRTPLGAADETY